MYRHEHRHKSTNVYAELRRRPGHKRSEGERGASNSPRAHRQTRQNQWILPMRRLRFWRVRNLTFYFVSIATVSSFHIHYDMCIRQDPFFFYWSLDVLESLQICVRHSFYSTAYLPVQLRNSPSFYLDNSNSISIISTFVKLGKTLYILD